MEATTAKLN